MAGPIARRPGGLLDLLLAQQQGQNPAQLSDFVQPVIDLEAFYSQERLEIDEASLSASAIGQANTQTVPAGEAWRLIGLTGRATFNATPQTLGLSLFVGIGGADFADVAYRSVTSARATERMSVAFHPGRPLILPSGAQCGALVYDINTGAGGNITVKTSVLYVRMDT